MKTDYVALYTLTVIPVGVILRDTDVNWRIVLALIMIMVAGIFFGIDIGKEINKQ